MPEYIVTTYQDRNQIIRAKQVFQNIDLGTFEFRDEDGVIVALVPQNGNLLSIVEFDEAYQADFYDSYTPADDDPDDDVCLECQAEALADTDAFQEAVLGLIDAWHEDEPDTDTGPKVEHRVNRGLATWGVTFDGKFAPFGAEEAAGNLGLANYEENHGLWLTDPIEDCPLVEEGK
jgi:hypothetical protein